MNAPADTRARPGIETSVDGALIRLMGGAWLARAVAVAARLGIADILHVRAHDAADLAIALDADADVLGRLMRLLAACGVFAEAPDGRFANAAMAALLRSDHPRSLRHFAMLAGEDYTDAFGHLLHSVVSGESAFPQAFGGSIYDHMDRNPEAGRVYDLAMRDLARPVGGLLAQRGEFMTAATVVDVGGGVGALLRPILTAHPQLHGISADRADVCARGAAAMPPALAGRIDFVPTDFFASVPPGDVHMCKNVLHNWTDDRCCAILRTIAQAMGADGRLMLLEPLIDADDRSPRNLMDSLLQAVICERGAIARSEADLRALVDQAGLSVVEVARLPTGHGVIVCRRPG